MPRNKYQTVTVLPPASQFGRGECVIYQGEVLTSDGVNWTSQTGPLSYTAATLPDPTTLGAGATVVIDGNPVTSAAGRLVPSYVADNSFAAIGDSFTSAARIVESNGGEAWKPHGYLAHVRDLCGARINILDIFAQGGSGITANFNGVKFDTQLTSAISTGARNLIVMGGVNDVINDVPVDAIFTAYKALIDRAVLAGMRVFVCTQQGMTAAYASYTAARNVALMNLNAMLKVYCATKSPMQVVLIDTARTCVDPASTTGSYKSGFTLDNLHPNNRGAFAKGKKIADVLNSIFPAVETAISSNADNVSLDASSLNILTNGLMINATGGLATGYTLTTTGSASVPSPAVTDRADGIGKDQVLNITFTAANETVTFSTSAITTGFVDGDTLVAECECDIGASAALRGIEFRFVVTGGVVPLNFVSLETSSANDQAVNTAVVYKFKSKPFKYNAAIMGPTKVTRSYLVAKSAAAGSVPVKVGLFSIRKVV